MILTNLILIIQNEDQNKLFTIAIIGFVTILILLMMNLFKVNKLKKHIKYLENQLNDLK